MSAAAPASRAELPWLRPRTLAEALEARAEHPDYLPLAGGTDLMVQLHAGRLRPVGLIDLGGVAELRGVAISASRLRVGAGTPFAALTDDPDLLAGWPLLVEAAAQLGAVQIRNRATLGGNLVNASPAGDSLPPLAVYEARLELASVHGRRHVAVADFFTGYKETVLRPDELLVAVEAARPPAGTLQRYRKVGTRRAQALTKLSVAMTLARDQRDGRLTGVRLACGAVGPHVLRLSASEALLEGRTLSPTVVEAVRRSVEEEVRPIDDRLSTAEYRRLVVGRLVARFLTDLL